MKKIVFLSLFSFSVNHAGWLDFVDRHNAQRAYKMGEYQKSISILTPLDKTEQDWYNLGNSYYKEEKYKEAIKAYEKAPSNASKYHNLGNSYFKIKDYDNAIKSYEQALKIQKDKDTQYNLEITKKQQVQNSQEYKKQANQQKKYQQYQNNNQQYPAIPIRGNQQNNLEQKQLQYMLKSLKNKKIPTMMYNIDQVQRSDHDAKPW
ncbi:MAG: tetratricopeptide repeat protein [Sulfurovaceae bacterium]